MTMNEEIMAPNNKGDISKESEKTTNDKKVEKEAINIPISLIVAVIAAIMSTVAIMQINSAKGELVEEIENLNVSVEDLQTQIENIEDSAYSDNPLYYVKKITDFSEYLRFLRDNTGYTALFAIKDIQGYALTKDEGNLLKEIGFDQADILLEHEYHSFIGIIQDGKMVYQKVGGDEDISYSMTVFGKTVDLESATLKYGNKAVISIDGINRAVNKRAFNIVLLDSNGTVIDSVEFDMHSKEKTCNR